MIIYQIDVTYRSSHPEVFLGKGVLKICDKFTGEHPCRSAISIKLLCNFIQIALRHGWSPVNCMHIFGKPFLKNTSGWLLLPFDGILFSYYVYFVKYKLSMAAHPRMKFRLFQSTWYFSVKIFFCLYEWSRGRGYVIDIFVVSPYITKIVWSKNFQSHLTITFKYFA